MPPLPDPLAKNEATNPHKVADGGADAATDSGGAAKDAAPDAPIDAAPPHDASAVATAPPATDAGGASASTDGGETSRDGGVAPTATTDAGGGAPTPDAGPPQPPALTADARFQATGNAVVFVLNMEAVQHHPIGKAMRELLVAVPQWDAFMAGTGVDAVTDTNYVQVSGQSLKDTSKDVVVFSYSRRDADVEKAVITLSQNKRFGKGELDTGVAGVRGWQAVADDIPRALLRGPQPHVLAVTPTDAATIKRVAGQLASGRIREHLGASLAFTMTLGAPHATLADLPEELQRVTLKVLPRADGGANLFGEGVAADEAGAAAAVLKMQKTIDKLTSSALVKFFAGRILRALDIHAEGRLVKLSLPAEASWVEALMGMLTDAVAKGITRR